MEQMSLFDNRKETAPLASRIRPASLKGFVGQEHLLGPGKVLRQIIERDQISSMIFWGPPGVGKTTLASIIAEQTKAEFIKRRYERYSGNQRGDESGGAEPPDGTANRAVCGRDSSLQ